ncbi:MAG: metallophosphoesterase family protein [Victivallales bacterium]|nr:metallophosphoesterase family protein [Victivallales bacterium]
MLTAIIADIHGNIHALKAILEALGKLSVKQILCAGDIVGYGANPGECIDLLRGQNIPCCCGNHDSYVADFKHMPKDKVRPEAQEVVRWTRGQLSQEQIDWLAELPMTLQAKGFMVTHASCQPYPKWGYVNGKSTGAMHLLFQRQHLCFNGHSHLPMMVSHRMNCKPEWKALDHEQIVPDDSFTMIGVGAVGQPRDGDNRACAVLYDTDRKEVRLLRQQYDIAGAQKAIMDCKLPLFLADRLLKGI